MALTALGRWMILEWVRNAGSWLLGLFVLLLGPSWLLAGPLGIAQDRVPNGVYISSYWFISTYCGAVVGLLLLARAESLWDELPGRARARAGGTLIFASGLIHGLAALIPMRIVAPLEGWLWLPALLCAAHWAALGTFVQATAWPLASKWLALTCLGWWIPALLQGAPEWDRLRWTLSPERHFQAGISPIETSSGALVDTIPLVAWWVAAALVPTRSAFKR